MKRRDFVRYGLSVLGMAATSSSTLGARKAGLMPVVPPPPPTPPAAPAPVVPSAALPGIATRAELGPLLDRARAALDTHKDRLVLRDRVALADFSKGSKEHRFHIVDLNGGQTISYLVAHGRGSDPEHSGFLQSFSNEPGSLATCEGAFLTGERYVGVHGASMRLVGLDPTNDNADMRAIVVHGAPYVSEDHIAAWGKVGRSEGCFVVAPHLIGQVLDLLGPGRLIYAAKI
ncbi:murein L,D-transpeptidase catalytic domain family protein [Sphingobium sufflavum]|uniref:murein L,D-transpeptidase catalytic domain family protein n=1 Tax=Sphingobium sufflavum TaxID=1129547 RepID=UPI001F2281E1|nr:murein L,D-transpeptidase catalytic domain family protein [Sphingobium sufflavum]MCE7796847.1 murein L,D-transpeptidase catalytic domain family protein [Sphingobium sufflavum]